jgi:hypothetical protein
MNGKGCGRMQSWDDLRYYPGLFSQNSNSTLTFRRHCTFVSNRRSSSLGAYILLRRLSAIYVFFLPAGHAKTDKTLRQPMYPALTYYHDTVAGLSCVARTRFFPSLKSHSFLSPSITPSPLSICHSFLLSRGLLFHSVHFFFLSLYSWHSIELLSRPSACTNGVLKSNTVLLIISPCSFSWPSFSSVTYAAFSSRKVARASQVPGMRTQKFHASRITEVATRFEVWSSRTSPCRYGAVLSLHGAASLLLWLRLSGA